MMLADMNSKESFWRTWIVKNLFADLNSKQTVLANMNSKEAFWRTWVKNSLAELNSKQILLTVLIVQIYQAAYSNIRNKKLARLD